MSKCYIEPASFTDKNAVIRGLQMLMAEENEAAAHYSQIIAGLGDYRIKELLEEIHKDELNHIGVLLKAIEILDAQIAQDIVAGVAGE
jgi:hypothetical protein